MGCVITVENNNITHVYGRVQMLTPGRACFNCCGLLDPNEVRHDMMTELERQIHTSVGASTRSLGNFN